MHFILFECFVLSGPCVWNKSVIDWLLFNSNKTWKVNKKSPGLVETDTSCRLKSWEPGVVVLRLPQIRKWQCPPLCLASCAAAATWLCSSSLETEKGASWDYRVCVCVCVCVLRLQVNSAVVHLIQTAEEYFFPSHTHTHTHTAACLLTFHQAARRPIGNGHANEMGVSLKSWSAGSEWRVE